MKKRLRRKFVAKEGEIGIEWGKLPQENPELILYWDIGCKRDCNLLYWAITRPLWDALPDKNNIVPKSLLEELQERGYDISTLKITIRKHDEKTTE